MMKLMKYPLQFCVILRRSNCVRIVSACLVVLVGLAILIVFDFGSLTYSQLNQIERLRSNGSDSSLDWILKHLSSFSNSTEKEKFELLYLDKSHQIKPTEKLKRILFWTTFFDWKDFQFGIGQEPFYRAGCRFSNCITTDDRTFLNQSDALIFHPNNFDMKDLPSYRMPHQRYVFTYFEALLSQRDLPIFQNAPNGFFNWTMTYRRDSDIYSAQHYGTIRRKNTSSAVVEQFPFSLQPGVLPPDPAIFFKIRNQTHSTFSNKSKLIAWFTSNCDTPSLREVYFLRLAHYIPIDVYGECGNHVCFPMFSPKCDTLLNDYKFYIAAENSICADYVTEKFYRALDAGTIPIVYGGADYSAYAPPRSFIHVADFDSPEALADYLILLDDNSNLYSTYFEWKKDWEVIRHPMSGWCELCEKLNDPKQPSKNYKEIDKWWFEQTRCLTGESVMKKQGLLH